MSGTKVDIAADNSTTAKVKVPPGSKNYTVVCYAVDANDDFVQNASATAAIKAIAQGASAEELVYESDGTTARSIDLNGATPVTFTINDTHLKQIWAVPASVSAGNKVRLAVTFD